MNISVFNIDGKSVGTLTLEPEVWSGTVNTRILAQAVAMYRTNARAGLASTKRRRDVSGGGRKPWKQKHTGRARAGSIRSPLWRGGGSVFGPKPRKMYTRLPEKIRRRALLESLKGKLKDEELVVLDRLHAETPRTKPFGKLAQSFEVSRRSLIVLANRTEPLVKSLRNLAHFRVCGAEMLNAYDVLNAHKVLVTKDAFEQIEQRILDGFDSRPEEQRASVGTSEAGSASS